MKGLASRHQHIRSRRTRASGERHPTALTLLLLDKSTVLAGIIGPLMTVPQIWNIYLLRSASGVSVISWLAFGILDIPFVLYGIVHRSNVIVITYSLWLVVNFAVAFGAVFYR